MRRKALDVEIVISVPDLNTLATWPPESARAFLLGIAEVVSAKRRVIDGSSPPSAITPREG